MKKITTGIAAIAMLAQIAIFPASAFASTTTLQITGNGADSQNTTQVSNTTNTVVSQTNSADISNTVNASSSTGSNSANKNTGGDVKIDTGSSQTLVSVENTANSNAASVTNCNCAADATVVVSGNGADSKNNAKLELENKTQVAQSNSGDITNKVKADSTTGDNKADKNTGGSVSISTGDALTHVDMTTHANSNAAQLGSGNGNGGSEVSLLVAGNGADSKNSVWRALDKTAVLQQYNSSSVNNSVDASSSTGENKADKNTGGSTSIDTGSAFSGVLVDNAANFNWANIDCDCLTNVAAKVANNGTDTKNTISADLTDAQNIFQDNSCGNDLWSFGWDGWGKKCGVNSHVNADSATGVNSLADNTGNPGMDPEVMTGDSETAIAVTNTGNSNVYGEPMTMPTGGSNVNVNVSFNLSALLGALGIH